MKSYLEVRSHSLQNVLPKFEVNLKYVATVFVERCLKLLSAAKIHYRKRKKTMRSVYLMQIK